MDDVDIDPFGEHDKTHLHPDDTDENIPLNPGGGALGVGSTWDSEHEQETSFCRGKAQERSFTDSYIDSLYKELSFKGFETWVLMCLLVN